MCPPWNALGVDLVGDPATPAQVAYCDADRMVLHAGPGRSDALGSELRTAVREIGWQEDLDRSAPGMVNVRYHQDGKRLALSVVDDGPRTVAILTVIPQ